MKDQTYAKKKSQVGGNHENRAAKQSKLNRFIKGKTNVYNHKQNKWSIKDNGMGPEKRTMRRKYRRVYSNNVHKWNKNKKYKKYKKEKLNC